MPHTDQGRKMTALLGEPARPKPMLTLCLIFNCIVSDFLKACGGVRIFTANRMVAFCCSTPQDFLEPPPPPKVTLLRGACKKGQGGIQGTGSYLPGAQRQSGGACVPLGRHQYCRCWGISARPHPDPVTVRYPRLRADSSRVGLKWENVCLRNETCSGLFTSNRTAPRTKGHQHAQPAQRPRPCRVRSAGSTSPA